MTSISLQVTRFGLGVLGRIDADKAGRAAFRIFCRTPSRKPKTKAYAARLEQASNELSQAKRLDLIIDRGLIATYLFEPDVYVGRTSLVVHGWGSRTADMIAIIRELCCAWGTSCLHRPAGAWRIGRPHPQHDTGNRRR